MSAVKWSHVHSKRRNDRLLCQFITLIGVSKKVGTSTSTSTPVVFLPSWWAAYNIDRTSDPWTHKTLSTSDDLIDWLIEHGFTSAPTQYRLYGRRFLQVWWPNQQCQSTEGGWLLVSHPDRPQSNHAHLTVLQYYTMHADITQENNLTHTK